MKGFRNGKRSRIGETVGFTGHEGVKGVFGNQGWAIVADRYGLYKIGRSLGNIVIEGRFAGREAHMQLAAAGFTDAFSTMGV